MAVAIVPARGGSKSIPYKNIKPFCGQPLIYWCLRALQKSECVTEVIVATEDARIAEVVHDFGLSKVALYRRSQESARDGSQSEEVMMEYLRHRIELAEDYIEQDAPYMLAQCTSPYVTAQDIDGALREMQSQSLDSILSGVQFKRFFWEREYKDNRGNKDPLVFVPSNYDPNHRPLRQEWEGSYLENGAFYVTKMSQFLQTGQRLNGRIGFYCMPDFAHVEIDDEHDWVMAEKIMERFCQDALSNTYL